jgi:hypothetical protein
VLLERARTSLRLRALDARDRARGQADPLLPPRRLRGRVGDSDFVATGRELAVLVRDLGGLADRVADELQEDRMAEAVIDDLVALGRATATVEHSDDLSAEVVLAQVRSLTADLLTLCGMDPLEATDVIPKR